jgi:Transposase
MPATTDVHYAACMGIAWADRQPDVCRQPAGCDTRECRGVAHRPERRRQGAEGLRQRCRGRLIAVGSELTTGPLGPAFQRDALLGLCPVDPTRLAKARATWCVRHANDDATDAELALERLLTHPDTLRALQPESAALRPLPQLVAQRRRAVAAKVRLTTRRTTALRQYRPQVREWFQDQDPRLLCACLTRWPPRTHAQRARNTRLMTVSQGHTGR